MKMKKKNYIFCIHPKRFQIISVSYISFILQPFQKSQTLKYRPRKSLGVRVDDHHLDGIILRKNKVGYLLYRGKKKKRDAYIKNRTYSFQLGEIVWCVH